MSNAEQYVPPARAQAFLDTVESPKYERNNVNGLTPFFDERVPDDMTGFYTSDELMALRAEMAANNIHTNRMCVRYNPWNLGYVWVLNPLTKGYLKATAVDPAMSHMTQYQWNVLKRAVRDKFDEPEHLMNLAAGRNAIRGSNQGLRGHQGTFAAYVEERAARFLQAAPSETTSAAAEPEDGSLVDDAPPSLSELDDEVTDVNPDDLDVDDWGIATA